MALHRIQPDTGATIKPGPMVVAAPARVITDDAHAGISQATGLNGPFVADLLASCVTHERCGVNLFRALGAQTQNPLHQATFRNFRADAGAAVDVYETLIGSLGGNIAYVSPPARMTEAVDQKLLEAFLLSGSADPLVLELKGAEAVLLASTLCLANTSLLAHLAESLDEGTEARTAMDQAVAALRPPQEAHLEWAVAAQHTMVLTQAKSRLAQRAGALLEEVTGKLKRLLR
jgi:hypothetical protein